MNFITKDSDFQLSFELGKGPPKLLLVLADRSGDAFRMRHSSPFVVIVPEEIGVPKVGNADPRL